MNSSLRLRRILASSAGLLLIATLCLLQRISIPHLALTFGFKSKSTVTAATSLLSVTTRPKIVLTNDDGWDVFSIRSQFIALEDAGFNVVLSAPATDQSGTGSRTAPPKKLGVLGCQFFSCPPFSPPVGNDPTNPRLNYVNSFPATSALYGIKKIGPRFFDGSIPDLLVSGPNVGNNLGPGISRSGTVGAACEAAKEGIPSVAFSGAGSLPVPFHHSGATLHAALGVRFVQALLLRGRTNSAGKEKEEEGEDSLSIGTTTILPENTTLNVNFPLPPLDGSCTTVDDFRFILTRLETVDSDESLVSSDAKPDVETCGTNRLPTEQSVAGRPGCTCSVTVVDVHTKKDVESWRQKEVLERLGDFLSCL